MPYYGLRNIKVVRVVRWKRTMNDRKRNMPAILILILKRASTIFISFSQQNITVWKWMNESKRQGAEHAKTAQCLSTHS